METQGGKQRDAKKKRISNFSTHTTHRIVMTNQPAAAQRDDSKSLGSSHFPMNVQWLAQAVVRDGNPDPVLFQSKQPWLFASWLPQPLPHHPAWCRSKQKSSDLWLYTTPLSLWSFHSTTQQQTNLQEHHMSDTLFSTGSDHGIIC